MSIYFFNPGIRWQSLLFSGEYLVCICLLSIPSFLHSCCWYPLVYLVSSIRELVGNLQSLSPNLSMSSVHTFISKWLREQKFTQNSQFSINIVPNTYFILCFLGLKLSLECFSFIILTY
uniref:Uncharacterized protein n=1 Tax=Cacopsylla melanoneura TaxID=428564 RepID=A0A8D8U242_9HEMI